MLAGSLDTLRLVQGIQAVIDLASDAFCAKQIVKQPLLPQLTDVGLEYRESIWPEVIGLVDCGKEIFDM